jgi:NAD(P)-dependent dehydrogenase (short-subunit alcohol dehydrogenase family)
LFSSRLDLVRVGRFFSFYYASRRRLEERRDHGRKVIIVISLRRLGTADELASAAVFLASDESSFITGIDLPVDGGTVSR